MISFELNEQETYDSSALDQLLNESVSTLESVIEGIDKYSDSLGWINVEKHANQKVIDQVIEIAQEIKEKADVFVLIGVGGSNNAARSVIEALKDEVDGPEVIYSGNTLSPRQIHNTLKSLEGKSVYINCIAKNFETLEPGSSFRILRQYLYKQYGAEAAQRIITTGTKGSSLDKLSQENGYRFLDFPEDVGGRYTAMTTVGLLPMAVAGIDIQALVSGAKMMEEKLHGDKTIENPAYRYAVFRNLNYQKNRMVEMLAFFEPQFRWFSKWWLQLFAESEGKDNKGIYPTYAEYSEDLHAVGQYVQDGAPIMFETFLNVAEANDSVVIQPDKFEDHFEYLDGKDFWDINKAALDATVGARAEKLPVSKINIDALDAEHFGQLFYFYEFACYLSCEIMGVNPFDQPGVEEYKKRMFSTLKK